MEDLLIEIFYRKSTSSGIRINLLEGNIGINFSIIHHSDYGDVSYETNLNINEIGLFLIKKLPAIRGIRMPIIPIYSPLFN